MNSQRLIEADFPLRKVSEESVREKNIPAAYRSEPCCKIVSRKAGRKCVVCGKKPGDKRALKASQFKCVNAKSYE